jgi:hypothetical protein
MKRLALLLVVGLVLTTCIPAQEIDYLHVGPTGTLEWESNTILFAGDVQTFEVYVYEWGTVADDQVLADLTLLGTVPAMIYALDITGYTGDLYAVGVRELVDRGGVVSSRGVSWSYDGDVVDPDLGRFLIDPDGQVTVLGATGIRIGD